MIFTTFIYYALFLAPTVFLYRTASAKWRPIVIVTMGSLFFIYFGYTELGGVPGALCVVIFLWEAVFSRLYRPGALFCLIGIGQAIVILGAFKYWNFLISLFPASFAAHLHWNGAFLPLGISFFTFEFIHFAVDRLRGKSEPGGFWEYLAFIMFFPTMVAGPIKRFQDFLPKLREGPKDFATDFHVGVTRILVGLAKKFAVADLMTSLTSNLTIPTIETASRPALLLWILAYGVQIYFDFSSYSDIAIGSARLIGIRVPENFDWPYLQRNISLFWQHWHMSLSRWLFDYVYIPLGGSHGSLFRTLTNLMATMLVSGLWHGAAPNFILWGAWHGMMLVVHRIFRAVRGKVDATSAVWSLCSWALTFVSVNLGWAFFCMDITTAKVFFECLIFG